MGTVTELELTWWSSVGTHMVSAKTTGTALTNIHAGFLRNCVCFLMVEHLWIRLADIKEEAADEEWRASHPRLARWRKSYRYWRAQVKILVKWVLEQERTQRWLTLLQHSRERVESTALHSYLLLTRWGRCQPARRLALRLSVKELIAELNSRGLDHDGMLERAELLDALCGPEPARPEHEQQYEYDEDMCPLHQRASTVDKMV